MRTAEFFPHEFFQPFDKNAWMGFAGAEPFACGAEPLIAESPEWTVVASAGGVEAHLLDGSAYSNPANGQMSKLAAECLGQAVVAVLVCGGSSADLIAMGMDELIAPDHTPSESWLMRHPG